MEPELYIKFSRDLAYAIAPAVEMQMSREVLEAWLERWLKPFEESVIALAEKELGWGECDGECEEADALRQRIAMAIAELEG